MCMEKEREREKERSRVNALLSTSFGSSPRMNQRPQLETRFPDQDFRKLSTVLNICTPSNMNVSRAPFVPRSLKNILVLVSISFAAAFSTLRKRLGSFYVEL